MSDGIEMRLGSYANYIGSYANYIASREASFPYVPHDDDRVTLGVDLGVEDVLAHAVVAVEAAGARPTFVWMNPSTYTLAVVAAHRASRAARRRAHTARKRRRGYA